MFKNQFFKSICSISRKCTWEINCFDFCFFHYFFLINFISFSCCVNFFILSFISFWEHSIYISNFWNILYHVYFKMWTDERNVHWFMIEYFLFFLIRKNKKFAFEFGQVVPRVFESIKVTARLLSYYSSSLRKWGL